MKTISLAGIGALAMALWMTLNGTARAQTNFGVSNPGAVFQYFINGTNNTGTGQGSVLAHPTNNCPPLTLTAGATYTFTLGITNNHPFEIVTNSPGAAATHYTNAAPTSSTSGTMTLVIPATNYPTTLYYECNTHFFYGVITVVPPVSAPPSNSIISIVMTATNVTLISSGTTTTYSLVPEYNSNLVNGVWQDVPSFTNTFANGTNTTVFNRAPLDSVCGPDVFLRISQRPP
jgi:hypothetical protein